MVLQADALVQPEAGSADESVEQHEQQLGRALPVYSVPIFVRIIKAQETTGTFKLRKVELKQQGFDPALVDEPLFVLLDRDHGYQPLTRAIHCRILAGTVRW